MKKTKCFETEIAGYPIELWQTGKDSFTCVYGLEVKTRQNYTDAALDLGANIMHALACEGRLDGRMKGEQ